jgi:hypothetical protein
MSTEEPLRRARDRDTAEVGHADEKPAADRRLLVTLGDAGRMLGRVLLDWLGISLRRPRKGLPALALGFGSGLIVMAGLLLSRLNLFVPVVMAVYGGGSIAWAMWPQTTTEEPTKTPAYAPGTEQPTGTPAVVKTLISFWQDFIDRLPRRPRKGLPAVMLGLGLGLIVGGGLDFLFSANVLLFAIMLPAGFAVIVWAAWPQDDRWDE